MKKLTIPTQRINMNLPLSLVNKARKEAANQGLTFTSYIIVLLNQTLEKRG